MRSQLVASSTATPAGVERELQLCKVKSYMLIGLLHAPLREGPASWRHHQQPHLQGWRVNANNDVLNRPVWELIA
jgi:hypothetical protein